MYITPEQVTSANKASVEAILALATSQFAAFERLSTLNFNAAKAAFEEGLGRAKSLLDAKDPQEYFNANSIASQPALEKLIAYSRSVYEVAAQAQGEAAKFVEERAEEFTKSLVAVLDKASKSAPAGSDVAIAAVKSALAAASTAYGSFNKVAKQATEMAEANFTAATASTSASKARKHAAATA
ncbi:MAG TPA: phasin family protein [Burkholderiales bacterium]|nr:phasin family protein [Burkholderiales bacterium]